MSTPTPTDATPLAALAGRWRGTTRLFTPWTTPAEHDSETTAVVTPVGRGNYVTVAYTWAHEGKPCNGLLFIGHETKRAVAHASWVDSWHQHEHPLTCVGEVDAAGAPSVRGSYPAPEGPPWGWRIAIETPDAATFRILMYNVTPDGEEMPAVESRYVRDTARDAARDDARDDA